MTYARSRLWLGISGVGFLVVLALGSLIAQIPYRLLPHEETWGAADLLSLFLVSLLTVAIMIPFDLLGGWILPTRFNLNSQNLLDLAGKWLLGVAVQSAVYVLTALAILGAGRVGGDYAAMGVVVLLTFSFLFIQESLVGLLTRRSRNNEDLPEKTRQALRDWGYKEPKVSFYRHEDRGFTGGVAGLPGSETIILPESWLDSLGPEQLAITVARRLEAIATGSRSRGILLAILWIVTGFLLSTTIPGAGTQSVAQLITTCCGFTIWSFLGLLVLPTISRAASYSIDLRVQDRCDNPDLLGSTISELDQLQDDEPKRASLIETIFHPVPSVENRRRNQSGSFTGAWHVARMTLFLSWGCLGLLSRAVHCNVGRPELWAMLPTD